MTLQNNQILSWGRGIYIYVKKLNFEDEKFKYWHHYLVFFSYRNIVIIILGFFHILLYFRFSKMVRIKVLCFVCLASNYRALTFIYNLTLSNFKKAIVNASLEL